MRRYEDFVIAVQKVGDADIYAVNVIQPCGKKMGDASSSFTLDEVTQAATLVGADAQPVEIFKDGEYGIILNAALSPPDAIKFGDALAKILFRGPILSLWGECKQYASSLRSELSIRLDLTSAPELAVLPWEYLRLPEGGGNFVGLDDRTTIVRYLQTGSPAVPLKVNPPIRVLVAASLPTNLPALDTTQEIEKIKAAFSTINVRYVEVTVLPNATRDRINGKLKEAQENGRPFHVFHFIGHGVFDKRAGHGALVLEDAQGKWEIINDEDMGRLLQPYGSSLRLVVLNACEGSRICVTNSYTSVAAKVIEVAKVPAAIAMQFRISDQAAIAFAGALYSQIAKGENVETAVDEARRAVNIAIGARTEWATPVFYLRPTDSWLIDISVPKVPAYLNAHYDALKIALPAGKLVFFLGLNVNAVGRPVYDQWEPKMAVPTTEELISYFGRKLEIATAGTSLAGLSQRFQTEGIGNLNDEFDTIFAAPELELLGTSKLYDVLSKLAKKFTEIQLKKNSEMKLPGLLFVTATYDASLEKGFDSCGVGRYHVISFDKSEKVFSHKIWQENSFSEPILLDSNNLPNVYTASNDGSPIILKLPGEAGSSFAVSENDFFEFLSTPVTGLLPAHVLKQIRDSRHLYLGCDMQNWTIRFLRSKICQNWSEKERERSNAILLDAHDLNARFWQEASVQSQIATLDDYVEGLEQNVLLRL